MVELFGNKREPQNTRVPEVQAVTTPRLMSCGHEVGETITIDGRKTCSVCLEALNLTTRGLNVELVQTQSMKEALLFVHKRQTVVDPETHELLARAPTSFATSWRTIPIPDNLNNQDWATANFGLQSLTELFYGRPSAPKEAGIVFHHVQKYIGTGRVIYLQRDDGHVVKLAEVFDEDHIKLTPFMAKSLQREGFYALKVKYEPAIENRQQQGWYDTLKQEGSYHTDPEFEVLLSPE